MVTLQAFSVFFAFVTENSKNNNKLSNKYLVGGKFFEFYVHYKGAFVAKIFQTYGAFLQAICAFKVIAVSASGKRLDCCSLASYACFFIRQLEKVTIKK